ncbi:1231_t:CDS:2, partial [Entrophospora sp. SA101]
MSLKYLSQKIAQTIDQELMSPAGGGFSIDQLMELAGLSIAQAVAHVYDKSNHSRILVCCGPGNNGGDGLVAARHLSHFGYQPKIYYPKQTNKELYQRLVQQCKNLQIAISNNLHDHLEKSDLVIDAIFVDIPSAWDVEKGNVDNVGFTPSMLISLTAPKLGVKQFNGRHFLGGRFITP